MNWKELPYWLKGIISSFGVFFIQLIYQFIDEVFNGVSRSSPGFFQEFFINQIWNIFMPVYLISHDYGFFINSLFINRNTHLWENSPTLVGIILVFAVYICIGAFLGWLYGKIKSKKK